MQLHSIDFCLPEGVKESDFLLELISLCPSAVRQGSEISVGAAAGGMLPDTRFRTCTSETPSIAFNGTEIPEIPLRREGYKAQSWFKAAAIEAPLLIELLRGKLCWIDHTGVNLPPTHLPSAWEGFIRRLGSASALYAYPTGEPWFFILPATKGEIAEGLRSFPSGRLPRFEVVKLEPRSCVGIQLDLQTSLTRREIEEALPSPLGFSIPGLENYFRSVFLKHPWPGLEIRVDLRFGPGDPLGEWETGKWLAEGRRLGRGTST